MPIEPVGTPNYMQRFGQYKTTYKVIKKHTPFSLVFGMEALLPTAYLHPDEYQKQSQDIHPNLEKKMEPLKVMDLTHHEAEENMKHMQFLHKERHEKPQNKTFCNHCDHDILRPPQKEASGDHYEREQQCRRTDDRQSHAGIHESEPVQRLHGPIQPAVAGLVTENLAAAAIDVYLIGVGEAHHGRRGA